MGGVRGGRGRSGGYVYWGTQCGGVGVGAGKEGVRRGGGGGVSWVGYMGGTLGYVWGVRVVRGYVEGQFFAIFFKKSETDCVQEKLERVEKTESYSKN